MMRLNGWGSTPASSQMQAEALSRLVNNSSLMNPLFGGLMSSPVNPWLANLNPAARHPAGRNFPWFMPPSLLPQGSSNQRPKPGSFEKPEFKR